MKQVKDIEELKKLALEEEGAEIFIRLNHGLRSSKNITYDDESDTWWIYNGADDTEQRCSTKELGEITNIIEALDKGALWQY